MKGDRLYRRRLLIEKFPLSKEDRFLGLIDDIEIKIDKENHPDSIFFFNGEGFIFECKKDNWFYYSYGLIWTIFEDEYYMEYEQIVVFIRKMMKKHLKTDVSNSSFVGRYDISGIEMI